MSSRCLGVSGQNRGEIEAIDPVKRRLGFYSLLVLHIPQQVAKFEYLIVPLVNVANWRYELDDLRRFDEA